MVHDRLVLKLGLSIVLQSTTMVFPAPPGSITNPSIYGLLE